MQHSIRLGICAITLVVCLAPALVHAQGAEMAAWPNDISEEEIRNEVDKWAQQGVVSIKIKQATPGEAKILIEQAHKNGMTTAGHLANYNVESGKLADLLVVRGNPLDDIKVARNIRFVVKEGVVHDSTTLLLMAEGKIGPAGPPDHIDWELQIKPLRAAEASGSSQ
ncbi:MAG: hypothetical protein V7742_22350 [Halioglobus sp.]